jgi:hypothetical protein
MQAETPALPAHKLPMLIHCTRLRDKLPAIKNQGAAHQGSNFKNCLKAS